MTGNEFKRLAKNVRMLRIDSAFRRGSKMVIRYKITQIRFTFEPTKTVEVPLEDLRQWLQKMADKIGFYVNLDGK